MRIIKVGLWGFLIAAISCSSLGSSQVTQGSDFGSWIDYLVDSRNQEYLIQACGMLDSIIQVEDNTLKEFDVSNEVILILRALEKGGVIQWMGNRWDPTDMADRALHQYCKSE